MSDLAPRQLFITVVHGTWPDGLFRMLLGKKQRTCWFDDGSSFFTRLSDELGDIPHGIKTLRWSGKNSVLERDSAAYRLAEHLSAEHNAHPQAIVSRLVHGQELAKSPMDCQINTPSVPDGTGIKIITLVSDKYAKWFGRHGIYERDNCAKTISDWVRAQPGARRDS
jgi:hypothetical protein